MASMTDANRVPEHIIRRTVNVRLSFAAHRRKAISRRFSSRADAFGVLRALTITQRVVFELTTVSAGRMAGNSKTSGFRLDTR